MIYAPVLIPTLNRFEHLKRCIESLGRNTHAQDTELFISVDFPLKESHMKGYEQIQGYLSKSFTQFKDVHVFFQKENLGSDKNKMFLIDIAGNAYDRYIMAEDDNEFSPCFLDYMNKGMYLYEDDESVLALCGHSYDIAWETNGGNVVTSDSLFDPYGVGHWTKKTVKRNETICRTYMEELLMCPSRALKLFVRHKATFENLVEAVVFRRGAMCRDQEIIPVDSSIAVYMIDHDMHVMIPIPSLVRNWGDDGSGEHCTDENMLHKQKISKKDVFAYDNQLTARSIKNNRKLLEKYQVRGYRRRARYLVIWFVYYIGGLRRKLH